METMISVLVSGLSVVVSARDLGFLISDLHSSIWDSGC
jgi:hypothetical protein